MKANRVPKTRGKPNTKWLVESAITPLSLFGGGEETGSVPEPAGVVVDGVVGDVVGGGVLPLGVEALDVVTWSFIPPMQWPGLPQMM